MAYACDCFWRLGPWGSLVKRSCGATWVDFCDLSIWFFDGRLLVFRQVDWLMILTLNGVARQATRSSNKHSRVLLEMVA